MLYPNPKGAGAPLSCLRLKLLKKGIDDFEYLELYRKAKGEAAMQAAAGKLVKDIGKYDLDWAALEAVRDEVARGIEEGK